MVQKVAEIKIHQLIHLLSSELDNLPDKRKPGNNTQYEIRDAVLSAFSIFFTQSPSFLEHQKLMSKMKLAVYLRSKKFLAIIKYAIY